MPDVRCGEVHDGEIIEVSGDRFSQCQFIECQFTGRGGVFDDCAFTDCAGSVSGRVTFRKCIFWGTPTGGRRSP